MGKVGGATIAIAAFGAAAVAAGIKATRMAAALDASLRDVSTLLPGTVENISRLREQVVALSTEVPQTPELLSRGLYQVISAGISDAAEAMDVLRVSARAAVAGLTDTFTSVDAITTVLNAYQLETDEASRVSDVFFNTVREGKLQFTDLSANIGTVATSAALAGVSIEEVGAALATLTKFGINSGQAAVSLNRLLLSLTQQTDSQAAAAERMGVEFNVAAVQSKGLVGFLQDLQRATGGNIELLSELNPNIRSARAAFVLAGEGADEYGRILASMEDSGGAAGEAFVKINGSLQNQATILKNQVNAAWLSLGNSILPLVLAALENVNRLLESDTETTIRLLRALGREQAAATLETQEAERELAASIESNTDRIERAMIRRRRALLEFREAIAGGPQAGQTGGAFASLSGVVEQFRILPDLAGQTATEQQAILEGAIAYADEIRDTVRLTEAQQLALAEIEAINARTLGLVQQQNALLEQAAGDTPRVEFLEREIDALRERASILSQAGEAEQENVERIRRTIALRENELSTIRAQADLAEAQSEAFAESADQAAANARHARRAAAATTGAERERFLQQAEAFENTQRALQRVSDLEAARANIGKDISDGLSEQGQRLAELRKELEQVNALLADPQGLLEGFGLESQIDRANEAVDRLREAFRFQQEGFPGLLEDPGLSGEEQDRRTRLAQTVSLIEAATAETNTWRQSLLVTDAILQQTGVTIEQLPPELQALVKEWRELAEAAGETRDETERTLQTIIQDVSFAARGAVELANAFGLVGDEAASALNQITLIGEGIGRIASGDVLAGVGGALSGIAGLVGGLFSGGPTEGELDRREHERELTDSIRRLTAKIETLRDALTGIPSRLLSNVQEALEEGFAVDISTDGVGFYRDRVLALDQALEDSGVTLGQLERAAGEFGIPVDNLIEALRTGQVPLDEFILAFREAEELFEVLDTSLSDVLDNVSTRLGFLRDSFDALDIEDPTKQLGLYADELDRVRRETIAAGNAFALTADDIERIRAGDESFIEDLFQQATTGTGRFTDLDLGDLSFDEFLDILRDVERIQDRIAESVEGDEGDFQQVSAINRLTVEQGDTLISLAGTRNFYLEDIRDLIRGGAPVQVTDRMLDAAARLQLSGSVTINVNVDGDVNPETAAVIGDATRAGVRDAFGLDRDLGTQLRRERAGLGLPPVREQ